MNYLRLILERTPASSLPDEGGSPEPLFPQRMVRADTSDLNPDLIDRLSVDCQLAFAKGRYQVPIYTSFELPVEIPEDCTGHLTIRAATPQAGGATLLESFRLDFSRPVYLDRVLNYFSGSSRLYRDKDLPAVQQLLSYFYDPESVGQMLRQVSRQLPDQLGRFSNLFEQGVENLSSLLSSIKGMAEDIYLRIALRSIELVPSPDGTLEGSFSGEVLLLDSVTVPFKDKHLPRLLIPSLSRELGRLLSDKPLGSAYLNSAALPEVDVLALLLLKTIRSATGSFELEGELPGVHIEHAGTDGGLQILEIGSSGRGRLSGHLGFECSGRSLTMQLRDLSFGVKDARAELDLDLAMKAPTAELLVFLLRRKQFGDQLAARVDLRIRSGSTLANLAVSSSSVHKLLKGSASVRLAMEGVSFGGRYVYRVGDWGRRAFGEEVGVDFAAAFEVLQPSGHFEEGTTLSVDLLRGRLKGFLSSDRTGALRLALDGEADCALSSRNAISAFPEFALDSETLSWSLGGKVGFEIKNRLRTRNRRELDFKGSLLSATINEALVSSGPLQLQIPAGSRLGIELLHGVVSSAGLGGASARVRWDMNGASPTLRKDRDQVEVFVPELWKQEFILELSPTGGFVARGPRRGLFDATYFNALLHPSKEPGKWIQILRSEDAIERVRQTLALLNPDLGKIVGELRKLASRVEQALDEEHVKIMGDLLPAPVMARVFSRVLAGDCGLAERLLAIILGIVHAEGLDQVAARRVIDEVLDRNKDYDFEVLSLLRWVARLLEPDSIPGPPARQPVIPGPEEFEAARVPSAVELYRLFSAGGVLSTGDSRLLSRLAPYLSLEQLEWMLLQERIAWDPTHKARLVKIRDMKRTVAQIAQDFGGLGNSAQSVTIYFFLAELLATDKEMSGPDDGGLLPWTFPGPADAAVLLQAGLANAWSGRWHQLAQRSLIEKILSMPALYIQGVFDELCAGNPRVLAGILMSLLEMDQSRLVSHLDVTSALGAKLGISLPVRQDYMAGGKFARLSYYEALNAVAERIVESGELYRAVRRRLQQARPVNSPARTGASEAKRLAAASQLAISGADSYAEALRKRTKGHGERTAARRYQKAFQLCSDLLSAEPLAIAAPWFKRFWARNYEALVIRSVLGNVEDRVDACRDWFLHYLGAELPSRREARVDAVIDVLYLDRPDKVRLWKDPLVHLLLPAPEGSYDFTVVSCMGVYTSGAKGTELQKTFGRLSRDHGVRVLRADTATNMPLEYNARKIIETIETIDGPWGFLGYSQGCANALLAESMLCGGTPARQRSLDRLVTRNFLFSAFNGSAHGTSANRKFLDAMVGIDHFFAHYRGRLSRQAIDACVRLFGAVLDSRDSTLGILGLHSLSFEGVMDLHLHGQFKPGVPTCTVRAVVDDEILPEVLMYFSNLLGKLTGGVRHDTQVATDDAIGSSRWTVSPGTRVLADCDMGSVIQRSHHWSPLCEEAEPVMTPADRERLVYQVPKDRHVFPWVEVNARFGLIKRPGP